MPVGIELLPLFATGLLTGFGHCIGMCGPIIATFSLYQQKHGNSSTAVLLPTLTMYHLGRIMGLMMLGAIFGLMGMLASHLMGDIQSLQAAMTIIGGILILILGLGLAGLLPTQQWIEQKGPGLLVMRYIRRLLRQRRSHETALQLGIANGFLPCGPSYTVALVGFTIADPLVGMFIMLVFGMGTIPALLILGFSAGMLPVAFRYWSFRIAAVLVMIVGVQLILRGMAFQGIIDHMHITLSSERSLMVW